MKKQHHIAITVGLALSVALSTFASDDEWMPLFDGSSLEGWAQHNGIATYQVEDGTILGTTAKGSANSFLCTEEEYADFELEFEVKLFDNELNSGVQIRSKLAGDHPEGRVNGPQVEIEATDIEKGGAAGYIYGEACGGWMTPPENRTPHRVFKDGEWNHYRVVAKGPTFRTWINGEKILELTDEEKYRTHPKGFIGLQVHGVGNRGPYRVAWRNLRIKTLAEEEE